jgi:hypothetical protein
MTKTGPKVKQRMRESREMRINQSLYGNNYFSALDYLRIVIIL